MSANVHKKSVSSFARDADTKTERREGGGSRRARGVTRHGEEKPCNYTKREIQAGSHTRRRETRGGGKPIARLRDRKWAETEGYVKEQVADTQERVGRTRPNAANCGAKPKTRTPGCNDWLINPDYPCNHSRRSTGLIKRRQPTWTACGGVWISTDFVIPRSQPFIDPRGGGNGRLRRQVVSPARAFHPVSPDAPVRPAVR